MKVIVSDTTSLIVLEGLSAFDLLAKVFDSVLIPQAVFNELVVGSPTIAQDLQALGCVEIFQLPNSEQLQALLLILDQGEAEAITLALDKQLPILIDERKGRAVAQQKGLIVTGFVGLLVLATQRKAITHQVAKQLLDQAMKNGFRLSDQLYQQVLRFLELH